MHEPLSKGIPNRQKAYTKLSKTEFGPKSSYKYTSSSVSRKNYNGLRSLYPKAAYYNSNKRKAMRLINRAKDREYSEKKYLALSQKVVRNDQIPDENDEYQNMESTNQYKEANSSPDKDNSSGGVQSVPVENSSRGFTRHQKHRRHMFYPSRKQLLPKYNRNLNNG